MRSEVTKDPFIENSTIVTTRVMDPIFFVSYLQFHNNKNNNKHLLTTKDRSQKVTILNS